MAWLHSTPPLSKNDKDPEPRIKRLPEFSPFKGLPDCENANDLVEHFHNSGVFNNSPAGAAPLTWMDLSAYSNQSGYNLSGWESEQILMMSREYLSTRRQATDDNGYPPPYSREMTEKEVQEWRNHMVEKVMNSQGNIKVTKASKK